MNQRKKLLAFRTDRLGDVLMTLPALVQLRKALPDWEITFVCRSDHHAVLSGLLDGLQITLSGSENIGFEGTNAAVFFYAEPDLQWQAFKARVPIRVGTGSKWYSFFLLTKAKRQSRSRAEKSEALYNLEVSQAFLEQLGVGFREKAPKLVLPEKGEAKTKAQAALKKANVSGSFVLLHPGMGGSALNLSDEQYRALVSKISNERTLVVSFGPAESDQRLKESLLETSPQLKVIEGVSIDVLAEVFRLADCVIAPSTGPLHLAHYVGTRTVGLFSPVRTHHPARWAPFGGNPKVSIVLPEVKCPGTSDCIGKPCVHFYCMDKVNWAELVTKAL